MSQPWEHLPTIVVDTVRSLLLSYRSPKVWRGQNLAWLVSVEWEKIPSNDREVKECREILENCMTLIGIFDKAFEDYTDGTHTEWIDIENFLVIFLNLLAKELQHSFKENQDKFFIVYGQTKDMEKII